MLNGIYAECPLCWVLQMSPFFWVSLCWMSMLNVIMLNVIMLNVMAPFKCLFDSLIYLLNSMIRSLLYFSGGGRELDPLTWIWGLPNTSRTCCGQGLPWSTLVYTGLPWSTLVYPGLPWSTLVYPGLPWSTLVYPGLPWSTLAIEI